jgi:hypothetical protein
MAGLADIRNGSSTIVPVPHPEERGTRVSKDESHQRGYMVRDGAPRLLTMRIKTTH